MKVATGTHDCLPVKIGYYWATSRANGLRQIVRIGKDGFGHVRLFRTRGSSSHSLCDFKDFAGPIVERTKRPKVRYL